MTDDEITQYLETIKPIYPEAEQARLARIRERIEEINEGYRQRNKHRFTQRPDNSADKAAPKSRTPAIRAKCRQLLSIRK